ncbi:MAG: VCBS repeat-containing protein, partial [Anaerolineae bacterium]|nr:VCBS repeat-containing protein [Anaerolineae bacterium]
MMLRKNFALFLTLLLIVSSAPQTVRSYNELNQSFALQPPRSFATVANSGQVLGTIAVGNVDNDPALEIVVNSSAGINVYDDDGSAVSSFSTQASGETRTVNIAPTLADVDGDGRAEIIFATDHMLIGDPSVSNSVFAINGEDGSVLWEMPITRDTYSTPDSGYQTIAGSFYYDGATHDTLPAQTTFTANASAIPVYDLDDDGQLEAVVTLKIRPEPVQDYNPYINDIWG